MELKWNESITQFYLFINVRLLNLVFRFSSKRPEINLNIDLRIAWESKLKLLIIISVSTQRPSDVHNVKKTLNWRQNNILCWESILAITEMDTSCITYMNAISNWSIYGMGNKLMKNHLRYIPTHMNYNYNYISSNQIKSMKSIKSIETPSSSKKALFTSFGILNNDTFSVCEGS